MGVIKKLSNGNYRVQVYDLRGIRYRKTFVKKSEADAFVSKIEVGKNDKRLVNNNLKKKQVLIAAAVEEFMTTKSHLRKKSVQKYSLIMNQFLAFCNASNIKFVDEFNPDNGTAIYTALIRERQNPKHKEVDFIKPKPKTVNAYLETMRAFFKDEVMKGRIDRNPLSHLKNLKKESPKPEYYTEEEIKKFFTQNMHEAYRFAFLGLYYTGMRINELVNVTWDDINLERKLIFIRRKNDFNTKTDDSERAIPMSDTLYKLISCKSLQKDTSIYVFSSIKNKKLSARRMLGVCKTIGESAGIKGRVFLHKWRHTFATQLAQRKIPIEAIQKLMGHASIKETMVYAHVRSEELHDEVNSLTQIDSTILL
jgi:site-specific recombinase XerD